MFSILLLYLYNLCMLFTCGGNKEYYCIGVLGIQDICHFTSRDIGYYPGGGGGGYSDIFIHT